MFENFLVLIHIVNSYTLQVIAKRLTFAPKSKFFLKVLVKLLRSTISSMSSLKKAFLSLSCFISNSEIGEISNFLKKRV